MNQVLLPQQLKTTHKLFKKKKQKPVRRVVAEGKAPAGRSLGDEGWMVSIRTPPGLCAGGTVLGTEPATSGQMGICFRFREISSSVSSILGSTQTLVPRR